MDQGSAARRKRWILAAIKLLIVVVVLWCVRRTLVDGWEQLGEYRWRLDFWWLAAAGGLYLLGTLLCGIFWHRTLRALGQDVSLPQALRAYYIGHLGKYVPGKAMVVILRAGLVRGQGVDTALAAASVFFETLTMMAVGGLHGGRHRGHLVSRANAAVLGRIGNDGRGRAAHASARVPAAGATGRRWAEQSGHRRKTGRPGLWDHAGRLAADGAGLGRLRAEPLGRAAVVGGRRRQTHSSNSTCTRPW